LIVKSNDAGLRTRRKVLIDLLLWLEPDVLAVLNIAYSLQFGKVVDVSGSLLSRYEKNQRQPNPWFFERVRKKTGVDLNWLLCGDGEMFPQVPVDIEQKLKIVREIMRSSKKIRQLLIEPMKP